MKARLSFVIAVFACCSICQAQKKEIGVTANINTTQMDAQGLSSSLHSGYNGGVYAKVKFGRKWSLQPEVLYTLQYIKKASDFRTYYVASGRTTSYTNINLYALSVPILINYRLSNLITISAGPEYNRMLYSDDNLLKDDKSAFKRNTGGLVGGIQFTLSPSISLFGNYYYNLTDVNGIDSRYQWHYSQLRFGINVRVL